MEKELIVEHTGARLETARPLGRKAERRSKLAESKLAFAGVYEAGYYRKNNKLCDT